MHAPEFILEVLDFGIGIGVAVIEAAPSAKPAAKAESEVEDFSECAASFVLGCYLTLERFRGHDAVRLELRIAGLVVFSVGFELPNLASEPRQYAAFDGAEISTHEGVPGRRTDDGA